MKEREIREYQTEAGKNPFREWLHGLLTGNRIAKGVRHEKMYG